MRELRWQAGGDNIECVQNSSAPQSATEKRSLIAVSGFIIGAGGSGAIHSKDDWQEFGGPTIAEC
jgi:hypothetical protein